MFTADQHLKRKGLPGPLVLVAVLGRSFGHSTLSSTHHLMYSFISMVDLEEL
jgi:hypothetical protein